MFGNSGLQLPGHLIINIDIINFLLVKYTASNESKVIPAIITNIQQKLMPATKLRKINMHGIHINFINQ